MSEPAKQPAPYRFDVKPDVASHFAWIRTRLALERTSMSWVRTSIALLGFGFTIYQFLDKFNGGMARKAAVHTEAPRILGLLLIGCGLVALIVAIIQYRQLLHYMWDDEFKPIAGFHDKAGSTQTLGVMVLLLLVGIFAFVAVLERA